MLSLGGNRLLKQFPTECSVTYLPLGQKLHPLYHKITQVEVGRDFLEVTWSSSPVSKQLLKISKERLHNLPEQPVLWLDNPHTGKECFLVFRASLLCSSLQPLPLVLALGTLRRVRLHPHYSLHSRPGPRAAGEASAEQRGRITSLPLLAVLCPIQPQLLFYFLYKWSLPAPKIHNYWYKLMPNTS